MFAANDPPAFAVGLTPHEMMAYLTTMTSTPSAEDLTVLAREISSGAAAGALIAHDAAVEAGPTEDLSPKFEPIMGIFGQLNAQMGPSMPPRPGETLSR